MPTLPFLICLVAVVVNLLSWMHCLSWETQPPFFYTPKFTSLRRLRWTMVAIAIIPVILYGLGLLPTDFLGVTSDITFYLIFLGVTVLSCYSVWRRYTRKI